MNEEQRRTWPHVTVVGRETRAAIVRSHSGIGWATLALVALIFAIRWVGENFHAWSPDSDLTVLAGMAAVTMVVAAAVAIRDGDKALLQRLAVRVGGMASVGAAATISLAIA